MSHAVPPISDEHLVAYLDGELDSAAAERVESQLAVDAQLRHRLARLEQSWNLLDDLPTAPLADDFAATTVTMVADAMSERPSSPPWRMWVLGIAAGFLVAAVPLQVRRQQRIRDLPVIQNLELYKVADSAEFLQMLEAEGLFIEDVDDVL